MGKLKSSPQVKETSSSTAHHAAAAAAHRALPRNKKRPRSWATCKTFTVVPSVLLALYLSANLSLLQRHHDISSSDYTIMSSLPHWSQEILRTESSTRIRPPKTNNEKPQLPDKQVDNPQNDECTLIESEYRTVTIPEADDSSKFSFDRERAETHLQAHGASSIRKIITAYLEPPLNDTIPGTGSRGNFSNNKDLGTPPEFKVPLPLRKQTPADLLKYEYPRVETCHDMPGKFPVDRGLELDANGNPVVWNVGNEPMPPDFPQQEAPYCPVEADPFLPWIHDVFPSQDGSRIEFVAQNRRRCRTGVRYTPEVNRLVPQVALMQSISVQRINETKARALAPELWHGGEDENSDSTPRYRLAPLDEASPDGIYTRFICRFHTWDFSKLSDGTAGSPQTVVIGETLSLYPFNYDFVSYRKGFARDTVLTPQGKDSRLFWTSNIRFHCPLPSDEALRAHVAMGNTVLSNGSPTLFVDLIPIRTSVRYAELHMTDDLVGPPEKRQLPSFDAKERWGPKNVLPRVEASGRWTNIPICEPPKFRDATCGRDVLAPKIAERPKKPHVLSACLWASAEFKTRGHTGDQMATKDTQGRLEEWIEFHLMVGFDHFYIFDNSGAHSDTTSLADFVDKFPGKVTIIDWRFIVCNNNIPKHDSTGERSSQYAAENACRTRYAPFTEWIGVFDPDEYLVPMGKYTNLKDVVADASKGGTNILSFGSSRSKLRADKSDLVAMPRASAREKSANVTFLEAYNCDSAPSPKPSWTKRARKQVFRSDYVLYHYVHYSTVTQGLLDQDPRTRVYSESKRSERATDDMNEAVMVHAKSLKKDMTARYQEVCKADFPKKWMPCWIAFPFPANLSLADPNGYNSDGYTYNCYVNERVENVWVPKLREAMRHRRKEWAKQQEGRK